jgi:hypothetical protein
VTAHQLGQSTQKGQQVKASRDSVRASRRDTQASLKPTAKGSESTNSSSSQLLSCAHHGFHLGSERACQIHSLPGTEGTRVTKACRSCSMACIWQTVMQRSANPCGWCMHAHLSQTGHPLREAGCIVCQIQQGVDSEDVLTWPSFLHTPSLSNLDHSAQSRMITLWICIENHNQRLELQRLCIRLAIMPETGLNWFQS